MSFSSNDSFSYFVVEFSWRYTTEFTRWWIEASVFKSCENSILSSIIYKGLFTNIFDNLAQHDESQVGIGKFAAYLINWSHQSNL